MRRAMRWMVCGVTAWAVAVGSAGAQNRVMCLGDSITQGGQNHASYRYALWFDLLNDGHVIDFVGQRDFINGGATPTAGPYPDYLTTFDRDHEGYWGWRTDEIDGIIAAATTAANPQFVLIHLGTNDIGQMGAAGVTNADTNLRSIIAQIRGVVPDVVILLAQVIPIGPGSSYFTNADQVVPLNSVIATIAADLDTPAAPVILVDQATGYDLGAWMQSDGLHPNVLGEQQIADVWRATLGPLLPAVNPAPSVVYTAPPADESFERDAVVGMAVDAVDSNGSVVEVRFSVDGVEIAVDTTAPYTTTWVATTSGSHRLTATALDDEGAVGTSDPLWITVTPPADATAVTVLNPSFEVPSLADSTLASGPGVVGDWDFVGTADTFVGIFNPPSGSYPEAAGSGTPDGADGINAAFLFNNGGPAEMVSATQVLGELVLPDNEYTLTVAIGKFLPGQPYVFSTYGGFCLELLGGTTVLGQTCDTVDPTFGEFRDAALTLTTADGNPGVGLPLAVRLTLAGDAAPRSTHFDHVRVHRRALQAGVPAASSVAVGILMVGLIGAGVVILARRGGRSEAATA